MQNKPNLRGFAAGTPMCRCASSATEWSTTTPAHGWICAAPTSPSDGKEWPFMNTSPKQLTIVIPAKNESRLLPKLLESLCQQDYSLMRSTKVLVADAGSTDGTRALACSFAGQLDLEVIPGGLPSVGRNAGARRAQTPYVLFIDADMELKDRTLIRRAVELAERRKLHCVTTNIWCSNGRLRDQALYVGNNIAQYGSMLVRPFSTGMFMLFAKAEFN